jgi:formylglycine-generating enzyme required for sulfatase activity
MNRFVSALILFLLMTGAVSSQETATEVMPAKVADGSAAKDATNKSADQKPPVADKRVNTGEDSKQTDGAAAMPTNSGGTEHDLAIAQLAKLQDALIAGRIDKETYEKLKGDLLAAQKQNKVDSQSSTEDSLKGGRQHAETLKSATDATAKQTKAAWDEIGQIDVELRSIAQRDPAGYYEQLYVQYARINTDYVDDDLRQIVQDRIRVFMNLHSSVVEYLDERAKIVKGVDAASQFGAAVGSTNQNNPQGNAAAGAIVFGLIGSAVADTQLKEINAKYGPKILSLEAEANETESRLQSLGPQLTEKYGLQFSQRSATAIAISKLPPLRNSIGLELKLLPAGTFTMGSSEGGDETPHQVTLTRPFYLGVYEVTQEQYEQVMGQNLSEFKGARNPIERVSWEDAVEFCRKLSALPEEKAAGRVYRLPTEAEWEYACRAGSTTKYCFGDSEAQLGDYAWFRQNSGSKTHPTHPVGEKPVGEKQPNGWGLYDMHGNVWEWCSDWYVEYPKGAVSDPTGAREGSYRVLRGGGWVDVAADCRSAHRYGYDPSDRNMLYGFRVALSSPEIPK